MEVIRNNDGFRIECTKLEMVMAIFDEARRQDKVSTSEIDYLQPVNVEVLTDNDGQIVKVIALFTK